MLLILLVGVGGAIAGAVFFIWAHGGVRLGELADDSEDSAEIDRLIEEVGNVDRPRAPGESGFGEPSSF